MIVGSSQCVEGGCLDSVAFSAQRHSARARLLLLATNQDFPSRSGEPA
jgi:hypothetical protein